MIAIFVMIPLVFFVLPAAYALGRYRGVCAEIKRCSFTRSHRQPL